MRRLDWWLGIAGIMLALVCHAVFPRYEPMVVGPGHVPARFDRWSGQIVLGMNR